MNNSSRVQFWLGSGCGVTIVAALMTAPGLLVLGLSMIVVGAGLGSASNPSVPRIPEDAGSPRFTCTCGTDAPASSSHHYGGCMQVSNPSGVRRAAVAEVRAARRALDPRPDGARWSIADKCWIVPDAPSDDLDRLTAEYRSGSLGTLDYLMAVDELEPDAATERWRSPKSPSKPLEVPSKGIARIWDQEPVTASARAAVGASSCSDCETVSDGKGAAWTVCTRNCRPGPSGP